MADFKVVIGLNDGKQAELRKGKNSGEWSEHFFPSFNCTVIILLFVGFRATLVNRPCFLMCRQQDTSFLSPRREWKEGKWSSSKLLRHDCNKKKTRPKRSHSYSAEHRNNTCTQALVLMHNNQDYTTCFYKTIKKKYHKTRLCLTFIFLC